MLDTSDTFLQVRQKEQGDDEAQGIDETFVDAYVAFISINDNDVDNAMQARAWSSSNWRLGYWNRSSSYVPDKLHK